ncbi:MAG: HAD-IA family hydrolase [Fimbriimonadaceae bacterium]|nr:HAD-IA family hydrolase [Fimbriimonadaceae bacterium]QYK56213.1 MAG: HAD-IA family hydrolase [Fimbriimonadaceae bacterium]
MSSRWHPGEMAASTAERLGFGTEEGAAHRFEALAGERWGEFREINLRRDREAGDRFWLEVMTDWARGEGLPDGHAERLVEAANERIFGQGSEVFRVFDDVVPCLRALGAAGIPMAVVSNWDMSLHRTLSSFGLDSFFCGVFASMETGYAKPQAEIFRLALECLGTEAHETLHVGDHPVDDLRGAKSAGMQALIVDRGAPSSATYISSLEELPARIGL